MKRLVIILFSIIIIGACKKDVAADSDYFSIEIKSPRSIDCGVPEIIFLTRQQEAFQIIGDNKGTYVALGLPKVLYPSGTKMDVLIHKPSSTELAVCTTLGPSLAQVFIEKIK